MCLHQLRLLNNLLGSSFGMGALKICSACVSSSYLVYCVDFTEMCVSLYDPASLATSDWSVAEFLNWWDLMAGWVALENKNFR
jgi:hypothetical protein